VDHDPLRRHGGIALITIAVPAFTDDLTQGAQAQGGRTVAQQGPGSNGGESGKATQGRPAHAPAFRAQGLIDSRYKQAGEDDGKTGAGDHKPGRPAPNFVGIPLGDQNHHRHIGRATAKAGQRVEKDHPQEAVTLADDGHGGGDQKEPEDNGPALAEAFDHPGRGDYRNQVADKIGGTDGSHLGIAEAQVRTHGGQQHAEPEASEAEAGKDRQRPGKDDNPAVMKRHPAGNGGCDQVSSFVITCEKYVNSKGVGMEHALRQPKRVKEHFNHFSRLTWNPSSLPVINRWGSGDSQYFHPLLATILHYFCPRYKFQYRCINAIPWQAAWTIIKDMA